MTPVWMTPSKYHLKFVEETQWLLSAALTGDEFKLASAFCFGKLVQKWRSIYERITWSIHLLLMETTCTSAFRFVLVMACSSAIWKRWRILIVPSIVSQGKVKWWAILLAQRKQELFVFLLDLIDCWKLGGEEIAQNTYVRSRWLIGHVSCVWRTAGNILVYFCQAWYADLGLLSPSPTERLRKKSLTIF